MFVLAKFLKLMLVPTVAKLYGVYYRQYTDSAQEILPVCLDDCDRVSHINYSFVPRPPPFLSSVCVHNNTRERKTGKKTGKAWEHSSHE